MCKSVCWQIPKSRVEAKLSPTIPGPFYDALQRRVRMNEFQHRDTTRMCANLYDIREHPGEEIVRMTHPQYATLPQIQRNVGLSPLEKNRLQFHSKL